MLLHKTMSFSTHTHIIVRPHDIYIYIHKYMYINRGKEQRITAGSLKKQNEKKQYSHKNYY